MMPVPFFLVDLEGQQEKSPSWFLMVSVLNFLGCSFSHFSDLKDRNIKQKTQHGKCSPGTLTPLVVPRSSFLHYPLLLH